MQELSIFEQLVQYESRTQESQTPLAQVVKIEQNSMQSVGSRSPDSSSYSEVDIADTAPPQ